MYNAFAGFSDDPERRRRGVEEMRATYAAHGTFVDATHAMLAMYWPP